MASRVKRLVVGRPLATAEEGDQRLPKRLALPTFASDAVSSTAYATDSILFVTAAGASSLALGLSKLVPISLAVAVLLALVVTSYRETIYAYPNGGGSYIVSRENLGQTPSLVAGGSLLVDYVLTVAVSVSSGVAALLSMPALQDLARHRVVICLAFVVLLAVANLRGLRQAGGLFAVPFYLYVASMLLLLGYGLVRSWLGDVEPVPFDAATFEGTREAGGTLSLFLLLRGFSSGAIALTGVEAISNGTPAFREPRARNAARTLVTMAVIMGVLFVGVALLADHLHPFPSTSETVLSQMAGALYGNGVLYVVLQVATALILALAANTAFADFPRLSSIMARDGYLPRALAHRGDRLVFSNGVVALGVAAAVLIVVFRGVTNALVPLYAIGVFTAFTLSQTGMVRHHTRAREAGWHRKIVVSALGAVATLVVLVVFAVTKFTEGAWIPIVVVPLLVLGFLAVRRRYDRADAALAVDPGRLPLPPPATRVAVVVVMRAQAGAVRALLDAQATRPDHVYALHVADDPDLSETTKREWDVLALGVELTLVDAPFRSLTDPLLDALHGLRERHAPATLEVYLVEAATPSWYLSMLFNRTIVVLREQLVEAGYRVTTVPVELDRHGSS